MNNEEQLELLQALQEKYDTMTAEIHGERLNKTIQIKNDLALKELEYQKLLAENNSIENKISNTKTIRKQDNWKILTDILDGVNKGE